MGGTKRRILVVLHDFALGGVERVAVRLCGAWSAEGREVALLSGDPGGPTAALVAPGVEQMNVEPPVRRGPGSVLRLGRAAAEHLARRPADLVFVPGNHLWGLAPAVADLPRETRPPPLVAQLSNPLRRPDRGPLRRGLFEARARRELAAADAVVTLTEEQAGEVDRLLERSVATRIALPALDDAAPPPRPRPGGPPTVLCLGRLAPQKGLELALAAFARMRTPQARLVFAGEGPSRTPLERRAGRLGVADRVSFIGYVADGRPALDAADVLLVPSRYEGYAAVVVEALAAGRPVVATAAVPAAVELVASPDLGAVLPGRDPAALAEALDRTLARPAADPAVLARVAEPFRLGPSARAYLDLFDRL